MPTYVNTLPQNVAPIKTVTLQQLIDWLPMRITPMNVWIAGKIARFGQTAENLIFLIEQENEPDSETMEYFDSMVVGLGIHATVSNNCRNQNFSAIPLYSNGNKIASKSNFITQSVPILTVEEVMRKVPTRVKWPYDLYLTGGLVKNGWSANDADIIVFDSATKEELAEMRNFFTKLFGWKTDVGQKVMPEREPVYLYQLYSKGNLCQS